MTNYTVIIKDLNKEQINTLGPFNRTQAKTIADEFTRDISYHVEIKEIKNNVDE